jgi:hypothetical protein
VNYDSKTNNEKYLKWYTSGSPSDGIATKDIKPYCKEDAGGEGAKKADPKHGMGE